MHHSILFVHAKATSIDALVPVGKIAASLMFLAMIIGPGMASAAITYDEVSQGDFSDNFASPTDLGTLDLGNNTLSGESTAGSTEDLTIPEAPDYPDVDVDLWTLNIAPGQYLNQIVLTSYSNDNPFGHTGGTGGIPGGGSFFAVQMGNEITVTIPDGSNLLGGTLIGVIPGAQETDNVLDDLGSGMFSTPPFNVPLFSGPLGAGTYTFWYQEGPMDTEYTLDFQVSTVPEPTSAAGLGVIAMLISLRSRSRTKLQLKHTTRI